MEQFSITVPAPPREVPEGIKVLKNGAWANKKTGKIVKAPASQLWDSKRASEMAKKRHAKPMAWQDSLARKTANIILKEVAKQSDKMKKPLNKMRKGKEGDCSICGAPFELTGKMWMDFNHDTGKERGYVCPSCNGHMGWLDAYIDKVAAHIKKGI